MTLVRFPNGCIAQKSLRKASWWICEIRKDNRKVVVGRMGPFFEGDVCLHLGLSAWSWLRGLEDGTVMGAVFGLWLVFTSN
jgi:hypothetical protein